MEKDGVVGDDVEGQSMVGSLKDGIGRISEMLNCSAKEDVKQDGPSKK